MQVSWAGALTGMPSLVRWLFILITTGSSGLGVLSPGVAAGDAFASIWVGVLRILVRKQSQVCKCLRPPNAVHIRVSADLRGLNMSLPILVEAVAPCLLVIDEQSRAWGV